PAQFLVVADGAEALGWIKDTAGILDRLGCIRVVIKPFAPHAGVRAFTETASIYADWAAANRARIAVVRPDRYVYGLASDADGLARILQNLNRDFFAPLKPTEALR